MSRGQRPTRGNRAVDHDVFAVLAAGGTGGHLYPALALADALVARGHDRASIRFVGARGHLEASVVPDAGYVIELLPGRGLQRRLTLANIVTLWEAMLATIRAIGLIRRLRPAVVVGFGSYAALPTVVAARLLRRPTVVHDRDAAPGLGNRIGVRLGARAATSLPMTALRGATLVGNPVRADLRSIERRPQTPPLVAFMGGSQGARTVNRAALGLYDRWRDRTDVAVHHVCGPSHVDDASTRLRALRRAGDVLDYELVGYEDDVAGLLERVAIVVARAGASTVAELTVAGVPSVLVPLAGSPGDHQMRNARALVDAGAALLVPDAECDAIRLDTDLSPLLGDPARLASIGEAARALGRPDAADRLADLVEEVARAE
ncbi:MAG: UDP-N-acetylglucosamine--N-acetylmuramyl-(pentapeptide) pyrophosphoryl-undecaprenol N-acetylglucosamine transferase [Acidimicrobiia bacterium]